MFKPEQIKELEAPLSRAHVRERTQSGRTLSYLEGWWAISEANRIFGFDNWHSETREIRCVSERERTMRSGPGWGVSYIAKVRICVTSADSAEIIREGVGSGHGIDADLGQAHESAIKEAETDARKRALMTFGNPFGLALYDKTRANVEDMPRQAPRLVQDGPREVPATQPAIKRLTSSRAKEIGLDAKFKDMVETCASEASLDQFDANFDKLTEEAPLSWLDSIRNLSILRREEIRAEQANGALDAEFKAVMA